MLSPWQGGQAFPEAGQLLGAAAAGGPALPSPAATPAGSRACALISMAVSSGSWSVGGKLAL